jgi:NAD+ kinase
VRCDGLVVATPAGSTGYNLANGGPIMAWGVEGYVVSFIAPHSLTARALVVAPNDVLTVRNRSQDEPADATVDGRPATEIAAGERLEVSFADCGALLAQLPDATFYMRLRQKFGRLATAP